MTPPLLRCERARLLGSALELGSVEARGPLLVLCGAWGPLFDLIGGRRELADGRVELAGAPAHGAAGRAGLGLALREPALPASWSLADVLLESARLIGLGRRAAAREVERVLGLLGLRSFAAQRLARLPAAEQRAAGIACALLGDPPLLALEEPLSGLEPAAQAALAALLERALHGRRALVSVRELPGSPSEAALAALGDEVLVLSGRRLAARGSYRELCASPRGYRLVVPRSADALLSALAEAGYEVRRMFSSEVTTLWVGDTAGLGTLPLLRAALAADAPLLELVGVGAAAAAPAET